MKFLGSLFLMPLLVALLGSVRAAPHQDQETDSFDDELLILSRLSEQLTVDQISLPSFRCNERWVAGEVLKKGGAVRKLEQTVPYEVRRNRDKRIFNQAPFRETRLAGAAGQPEDVSDWSGVPRLEEVFTGYLSQMFSLENRLSQDFKKAREERINNLDCVVYAFDTVPEISGKKIPILGKPVPLRQRGLLWISQADNRLVRLSARQLKLPKGCRGYEYVIDYAVQPLSGKRPNLPATVNLKVELNDRQFLVEQSYSNFEALP